MSIPVTPSPSRDDLPSQSGPTRFSTRVRKRSTAVIAATIVGGLCVAGGATAAGRYLITSTHQIQPSVLAQLRGNRGPRGFTGATGAQGPKGSSAPGGLTGATGAQGPQGDPGAPGVQGPPGPSNLHRVFAQPAHDGDTYTLYSDRNATLQATYNKSQGQNTAGWTLSLTTTHTVYSICTFLTGSYGPSPSISGGQACHGQDSGIAYTIFQSTTPESNYSVQLNVVDTYSGEIFRADLYLVDSSWVTGAEPAVATGTVYTSTS
jgi:hypothetical protein